MSNRLFKHFPMFILIFNFLLADVFMTEITDPQNSSDVGRYVELYNSGTSAVDLSSGWAIQRWTNGNSDPQTAVSLTGTIAPGGFYIICNNAAKFEATWPDLTCDQNIGTGGAADSNGDDNMALLLDGSIVDMFGVAGEDGTGTAHEFEDGRAERASDNNSASDTWDSAGWNIDNDSGGGDGPQYGPDDFDPKSWIGVSTDEVVTCQDTNACNYGAEASCLYDDCAGVCGGTAEVDDCGVCDGDDTSCVVNVTFSVDMNIEGASGDVKVRTSTIDGNYSPSDWFVMDDSDNDLVFTYTMSLLSGKTYGYNFNDGGYESGSDLGDCAGGNYGNDRFVTTTDSDVVLDTVCWESCDACPSEISGCTSPYAENYNADANVDDGSCIYPATENLFFSEYAEGSSNNKYLEIYNAEDTAVDLGGYSLSSCSNGCNTPGEWDYADNVTFSATIAAGDVYVVCHGSASDEIQAECDQTFTYLSNGDDVFALTQLGSGLVLDVVGLVGEDPGAGWDVAGVDDATKDHTLVRKSSVTSGNPLWLDNPDTGEQGSAGDDADDSEWVVFDQNTWDYLGSHPHTITFDCAGVPNGDAVLDECGICNGSGIVDGACDCSGNTLDCAGVCGGTSTEDSLGVCGGDGTIQGAIDNAVDGDTVNVPDGTYTESILINKSINLSCAGSCLIDARGVDARAVVIEATSATLNGFDIVGDSTMYAGVIVTPACVGVTVSNNTIYGMTMPNPNNTSPLSYGILTYGFSSTEMPLNSTFTGNTIYGVAGSAISLGDNTWGTVISGNSFSNIIPVELLGQQFSAGVQGQFAGEVTVSGNAMENLIVGSNLPFSQGTVSDNAYTNVGSYLATTSPSQITFGDSVDYWMAQTTFGDFVFISYSSSLELAILVADDGSTIEASDGSLIVQDCSGAWGGDAVDADSDGVCDDVDDCVGTIDCEGVCNGSAVEDACGICGGDGTWCLTASITLGAATTTSLEVLYDSPLNIGGFQFNISGANVAGGSGGAAEANGFQVSAGGGTVLGFAFDGSVVPAGSGVLTNLAITATDFTGCISDIVLSDDDGDQFGTEGANCVDLPCPADADGDNVCDHSDACVGTYDCAGECNGTSILDCNDACVSASYLSWVGDGFCDATGYGDNTPGYGLNFLCEEYNFDLGDCDSYLDCADVYFGDSAEDSCGVCNGDNYCAEVGCPDGYVADCSGEIECAPASWIGDGYCDGEDQQFGYDLTCYENDGGDCATVAIGDSCADG